MLTITYVYGGVNTFFKIAVEAITKPFAKLVASIPLKPAGPVKWGD